MSARHSDIAKEIVLAMIAKARSCAKIETMLPGVLTAFGVISRELKELEEKEYAAVRELNPPVVESPRRRAKPYRVEGVEPLPKPKVPSFRVLEKELDRAVSSKENGRATTFPVGSKRT